MMKIAQWVEMIKDDVNEEEGITVTFFHHILQKMFWAVLLLGGPYFIYLLLTVNKLI